MKGWCKKTKLGVKNRRFFTPNNDISHLLKCNYQKNKANTFFISPFIFYFAPRNLRQAVRGLGFRE
jgi:hypothetical protein